MNAPRVPRERTALSPLQTVLSLLIGLMCVALAWIAGIELLTLVHWIGWMLWGHI